MYLSESIYYFYLNTQVYKYQYKCNNVKDCQYLSSDLVNLHHTHIDEELWDQIIIYYNVINLTETDNSKQYTRE